MATCTLFVPVTLCPKVGRQGNARRKSLFTARSPPVSGSVHPRTSKRASLRLTQVLAAGQQLVRTFPFPLTHLRGMNPTAYPIAVKPQEFLDPAPAGRDGARSRSPYSACTFVLVKELHTLYSAAHDLLGQFERPHLSHPLEASARSAIDEPTLAAYSQRVLVRESQVRP
jgi:hypothetical protein